MTDTSTSTDAVVLTSRISAPPAQVFRYLVEPEKLLRWMGTEADIEPEPGGKFRLNVNGTDIALGTYLVVEPPHRVVFTWGWEGSTDVPPGSSTVSFTLAADGDGTVVELRHTGLPGGSNDEHAQGWGHFMPRLVAVSEDRDPGVDAYGADDHNNPPSKEVGSDNG